MMGPILRVVMCVAIFVTVPTECFHPRDEAQGPGEAVSVSSPEPELEDGDVDVVLGSKPMNDSKPVPKPRKTFTITILGQGVMGHIKLKDGVPMKSESSVVVPYSAGGSLEIRRRQRENRTFEVTVTDLEVDNEDLGSSQDSNTAKVSSVTVDFSRDPQPGIIEPVVNPPKQQPDSWPSLLSSMFDLSPTMSEALFDVTSQAGKQFRTKQKQVSRIPAKWAEWREWGPCSKSCGVGRRQRTRRCHYVSSYLAQGCQGPSRDTSACSNLPQCLLDNNSIDLVSVQWAEWGDWSGCSRTCGPGGTRIRLRVCANRDGQCEGARQQEEGCEDNESCDGGFEWLPWSMWSSCSSSCGSGHQTRSRSCLLEQFGRHCSGDRSETKACSVVDCAGNEPGVSMLHLTNITTASPVVRGVWSHWSNWRECDVTCGLGIETRTRTCEEHVKTSKEDAVSQSSLETTTHADAGEIQKMYICDGYKMMSRHCLRDSCMSGDIEPVQYIDEGHFAKLYCDHSVQSPNVKSYWVTPGGVKLTENNSDRRHIVKGHFLYISRAKDYDAGTYRCVVENEDGKEQTSDATLVVTTCHNNPCQNNGRCSEVSATKKQPTKHFKCHCKPGYYGNKCQKKVMTVAGFVLLVLVISTVGFVVAVCVMCVINRDKSSEEATGILDDGKDVACQQNSYVGLEGDADEKPKCPMYCDIDELKLHNFNAPDVTINGEGMSFARPSHNIIPCYGNANEYLNPIPHHDGLLHLQPGMVHSSTAHASPSVTPRRSDRVSLYRMKNTGASVTHNHIGASVTLNHSQTVDEWDTMWETESEGTVPQVTPRKNINLQDEPGIPNHYETTQRSRPEPKPRSSISMKASRQGLSSPKRLYAPQGIHDELSEAFKRFRTGNDNSNQNNSLEGRPSRQDILSLIDFDPVSTEYQHTVVVGDDVGDNVVDDDDDGDGGDVDDDVDDDVVVDDDQDDDNDDDADYESDGQSLMR